MCHIKNPELRKFASRYVKLIPDSPAVAKPPLLSQPLIVSQPPLLSQPQFAEFLPERSLVSQEVLSQSMINKPVSQEVHFLSGKFPSFLGGESQVESQQDIVMKRWGGKQSQDSEFDMRKMT